VCPRSDVYATATMEEEEASPCSPSPNNVEVGEKKHLRKAAPAKMLLPRTSTWVASLPPVVQPTALVRKFARIANLIAATWDDPKSFDAYMESLLTDKRGKRQGFPADVLAELVTLQRYHDTLKDESAWNAVGKRG
jgi:hypothetical protein